MPNQYQNIVLCWRDYDHASKGDFDCESFVEKHEGGLFEPLVAEPQAIRARNPEYLSDASIEWRREHWGSRWDTYDLCARTLDGDGSPVLISFVTAWSAPCEEMRSRISSWLHSEYGLRDAAWIGLDPYDASTCNNGGSWKAIEQRNKR